jgi:hypothetical protein
MPDSNRSILFSLILCSFILFQFMVLTSAADSMGDFIHYSTDFSDGQGWTTNSPDRFFHDPSTGRYHYLIEGGTGGYSIVDLPNVVSGPFTLEFDITPVFTDDLATHRFGIGSDEKDSLKGPLLMAELARKKDGRLFYLKTVSKENVLNIVGSSPSTGSSGNTVRYEDNTTYHIRMTYYQSDNRASITVHKAGSPDLIFSTIVPVAGKMEDLTHLFLTSLGDGVTGPKAEGYIDNIILTLPPDQAVVEPVMVSPPDSDVVVQPTLAESFVEQTSMHSLTPLPVVTRTLLPPPPAPSPSSTPASGNDSVLLVLFFIGAAVMMSYRR